MNAWTRALADTRNFSPAPLEPSGKQSLLPPRERDAWHSIFSEVFYMSKAEQRLLELSRRSLARHLRPNPQLQAVTIDFVDRLILDKSRYVQSLEAVLNEVFAGALPARASYLRVVGRARGLTEWLLNSEPGLLALLIWSNHRLGLRLKSLLARAARASGQVTLAAVVEQGLKLDQHYQVALRALTRVAPVTGWRARSFALLLLSMWEADAEELVTRTELAGYSPFEQVGFDTPGFLGWVNREQDGMQRRLLAAA